MLGGVVEKGEILEEVLIREVKEEIGLIVMLGGFVVINEKFFEELGNYVLFFIFWVNVEKGEFIVEDEGEIFVVEWVDWIIVNECFLYYDGGFEYLLEVVILYKF